MINITCLDIIPEGFINPTIKNYTRKIEVINLTPNNNWSVPFKALNTFQKGNSSKTFTRTQYMLLVLIFNQL